MMLTLSWAKDVGCAAHRSNCLASEAVFVNQ